MHALPPMPTFTLWTGLLAPEVIMKALAQGLPDVVPACSGGDVCDVMALGVNPRNGAGWLEATNDAVGFGAHAGGDGEDGIMHVTEPGCRNNPIEVLENKAPMIIDEYGYRPDSGGAGKNRGGVGVVRAYRFLAPTDAIVINYKTKTAALVRRGRQQGRQEHRPGRAAAREQEREVGCSYNNFGTGGTITNLTGGGGGWGNPFERDIEKVVADVEQGFVSAEAARRDYGVVVDPLTLEVDQSATSDLRGKALAR